MRTKYYTILYGNLYKICNELSCLCQSLCGVILAYFININMVTRSVTSSAELIEADARRGTFQKALNAPNTGKC